MKIARLLPLLIWTSAIPVDGASAQIVDGPIANVNLVSISRAKCTLQRAGDPDIVHTFPGGDDQRKWLVSLRFDVTKNRHDIVTTCVREGFHSRTVTSTFGLVTTTVFGMKSTLVRYPGAIVVLLDRK